MAVEQIRAALTAHEPHGAVQWYIDENVIDCDAPEFWAVLAATMGNVPDAVQ